MRVCSFLVGAMTSATALAAPTVEPDHGPAGYEKVFADEFNGTALDPSNWRFDTERNAQGWYNQERQYYSASRPENARIEDGRLIIEARSETLDKARYPDWGGQKYTSARIIGQGKHRWT